MLFVDILPAFLLLEPWIPAPCLGGMACWRSGHTWCVDVDSFDVWRREELMRERNVEVTSPWWVWNFCCIILLLYCTLFLPQNIIFEWVLYHYVLAMLTVFLHNVIFNDCCNNMVTNCKYLCKEIVIIKLSAWNPNWNYYFCFVGLPRAPIHGVPVY